MKTLYCVAALSLLTITLLPVQSLADDGGVGTGGGNTVGHQLADDAENIGTKKIPAGDVAKLTEPFLKDLDKRVPGFAKDLRQGITGIFWYSEPKPLKQTGACVNPSMIDFEMTKL
jgi:hypothetical protein